MKIYLVGGAVRDKLLGLPVKERDWVVTNATRETMLKQGFKQVGKDFPVFLHPKTKEEYALARTERKIGLGYKGFEFEVNERITIEEDLSRRDLTINAMAEDEMGQLIDPFHGRADLNQKYLRHVSPAFSEDPVRILRVARFLARFKHLGFSIASETKALMQHMVQAGEVNALVAERVFKELERALKEPNPQQFFVALAECDALPILFPHLDLEGQGMQALQISVAYTDLPEIRFSVLLHNTAEDKIVELCQRYRVPNHFRNLALFTHHYYSYILFDKINLYDTEQLIHFFYQTDVFRRDTRFMQFLIACHILAKVYCKKPEEYVVNEMKIEHLKKCVAAVKNISIKSLLAKNLPPQAFAIAIRDARKAALAKIM